MRDIVPTPDGPAKKLSFTGSDKQPVNVRCNECAHEWVAAYLPMPIMNFARIALALCCPMCAAKNTSIFVQTPK